MRIVSWNCHDGFNEKAGAFLGLKPDIGIVPESCENPAIAQTGLSGPGIPHRWVPSYARDKGLGIFAPGAQRIEVVEPGASVKGDYGLACKIEREGRQIGVVGVWTVSKQNRYLKEAEGIVERYAPFLKSGTTILAGDFNIPNHRNVEEVTSFVHGLEQRFGLVSAYHALHGTAIDHEEDNTLWHNYSESDKFHCDFMFVPKDWKILKVEVGTYAQWCAPRAEARSDHAPVIVDVVPT